MLPRDSKGRFVKKQWPDFAPLPKWPYAEYEGEPWPFKTIVPVGQLYPKPPIKDVRASMPGETAPDGWTVYILCIVIVAAFALGTYLGYSLHAP